MVHEKIKDLRDTLVETKTENQSTHEIVKDIRDYLVGEKDELETTNEIVRDIRDELADTQVGITTAEMVKEIHDQIDDPAEAPQTIEEMLGDFQTSLSETETVSGNIVRFDNARALPFKKLNVNFQPKQDGTPWIQDAESEPYIQRAVSVERAGNHISDSVVGGTLAWNQLVKDEEEKEVSGDIATFDDGAENAPLSKLEVEFSPIQDLHGYDSPWPAGGGKNLVDNSVLTKGYYGETGAFISASDGSYYTTPLIPVVAGETYTSSFYDNGTSVHNLVCTQWDANGNFVRQDTTASVTIASGTAFVRMRNFSTESSLMIAQGTSAKWQLEKGSSATAFAPYENICPIVGWGTGKNLLAKPFVYYGDVPDTFENCFFVKAGTYTFSCQGVSQTPWRLLIREKDKNGTSLNGEAYRPWSGAYYNNGIGGWLGGGDTSKTENSIVITIAEDCYIRCLLYSATASITASTAQLELGTTASSYQPYVEHKDITVYNDSKYGGTINWNQFAKDANSTNYTFARMDQEQNGDELTLAFSGGSPLLFAKRTENAIPQHHIVLEEIYGLDISNFTTSYKLGVSITEGQTSAVTSELTTNQAYVITKVGDYSYAGPSIYFPNAIEGESFSFKGLQLFDLTKMFGETKAEEILSMEQANTGDGFAWFHNLFPSHDYPYNPGEETCVSAIGGGDYWKIPSVVPGGINQWDEEWESGSITSTTGTNTTDANKVRSKNLIPVMGGETYYVKAPAYVTAYYYRADGSYFEQEPINKDATFTVPQNMRYMRFAMGSSSSPVTSIQEGSMSINYPPTDHDYHAYQERVYSINLPAVVPGGINIWDEEWEAGGYNSANGEKQILSAYIRCKNPIPIVPNTQYFYNCSKETYSNYSRFCFYDKNLQFVSYEGTSAYVNNVFTTPDNAYYMTFWTGEKLTDKVYGHDISINNPSTDHDYHAFVPLNVGYGGKIDAVSGGISNNLALITLDGTGNGYSFIEVGRVNFDFAEPVYPKRHNTSSGISNLYFSFPQRATNANFKADSTDYEFCYNLSSSSNTIRIKDPRFTDLTTAKAILAETPLTVLIPLATPTTASVDPHAIPSYHGDNNIWANCGNVTVGYTSGFDTLTLKSGRKYLTRIDNTDSMVSGSDQSLTVSRGVDNVFDLTQMFGTAVGDHFYNQGANYFRKYFGKDYYEYCAGELKSVEGLAAHETVGFNQWDEEWKNGRYNITTGEFIPGTGRMCCENLIPVIPGATYYFKAPFSCFTVGFDAQQNCTGILYNQSAQTGMKNSLFDIPQNVRYIAWYTDSTSAYNHDICINISDPAKNGTYEPYVKHTYPLGNVTLRGIPKLSGNKWYYDGDVYKGSGSVTRKYGVVDLGTLTWVYSTVGSISVFRQASLNNIQNTGANGMMSNGYSVQSRAANSLQDKDVALASTWWSSIRNIVIRDDDYTDPAEFKAAMSGVMLLYELAEPTTESAAKYTSMQIPGTVERYVTSSIVPVGHETRQMDIFPISGRNSGTIQQTGKNLFDVSYLTDAGYALIEDEGATGYGYYYGLMRALMDEDRGFHVFQKAMPFGRLTVSFDKLATSSLRVYFHYAGDDTWYNHSGNIQAEGHYSYTSNASRTCDGLWFYTTAGVAAKMYIKNIKVEIGATETPFDGYSTHSYYSSSFPSTVYGGEWAVTEGEIGSQWAIVDLSSLNYFKTTSGLFQTNDLLKIIKPAESVGQPAGSSISSVFREIASQYITGPQGSNPSPDGVMAVNMAGTMYFNYLACTEIADFKSAMQGVQLCYKLAEPTTISIAPQKISTYLGSNTIWSDGDQVEVEYRSKQNRENQENS